jgi:uncharacterized repeat protein (TIGR01451 family)
VLGPLECSAGTLDCDGNPLNGCETTESAANCGVCALSCSGSAPLCVQGQCTSTCATGTGDCDGQTSNGCELDLTQDPLNCGACLNACTGGTPYCTGGSCSASCPVGRGDCDGILANGCESDLTSDRFHCGDCSTVCQVGSEICSASTCVTLDLSTCQPTFPFANAKFEIGTSSDAPPGWITDQYLNQGILISDPQTRPNLKLVSGSTAKNLTVIMDSLGAGPLSQTDSALGSSASLRWPRFGNKCVAVNLRGSSRNVNAIRQAVTISATDIDCLDGFPHIRFVVAPVLDNPSHAPNSQAYYFISVTKLPAGTTLFQDFAYAGQPGVPWKSESTLFYTDWQVVDVPLSSVRVGDTVQLEIIAAGCSLGAHAGWVYVDDVGTALEALYVSAVGPQFFNLGQPIQYRLDYRNAGTTDVTGVVVTFNLPSGTTFGSAVAPCAETASGSNVVSCAVGALSVDQFGSLFVTVNAPSGPLSPGSQVVAGNYDITAVGLTPLLGFKTIATCANC